MATASSQRRRVLDQLVRTRDYGRASIPGGNHTSRLYEGNSDITVVHFEIHATDPDRLISFYSGLFGWTFQKWDGPMEYWVIRTGPPRNRGSTEGLLRRHGDAPVPMQAVNAFVCTIDVESKLALDRAVELGGTVALTAHAGAGDRLALLRKGRGRKHFRDDAV